MKYQFNKTELQGLNKQLKVRINALPTLKNKEAALRAEIKKYKGVLRKTKKQLEDQNREFATVKKLYGEFKTDLVEVIKVHISEMKIAGVKIPVYENVDFKVKDFSVFNAPSWFLGGIDMVKKSVMLKIRLKLEQRRIDVLERARKKTTQKVNLYEKVQIPAFEEAIIKIKRFLDDIENLDKAGQKIVKKRLAQI